MAPQPEHLLEAERVDLVLPVRHQDDGDVGVGRERAQHAEEALAVGRREPVRGLVEEQEPRPLDHRAAEQHELLLAEGQVEEALGRVADVERGGAESQEQAADAERLAELSAKLRLWRLLFFALSEYLGPAEGADAPSVA